MIVVAVAADGAVAAAPVAAAAVVLERVGIAGLAGRIVGCQSATRSLPSPIPGDSRNSECE